MRSVYAALRKCFVLELLFCVNIDALSKLLYKADDKNIFVGIKRYLV